jgi:predicted RNA-binding Zn ribbon-like protein
MPFAHDTEVALQAAAALVNTLEDSTELLVDVAALDDFVSAWGWTGDRTHDLAELHSVRELRPQLRQLWTTDRDETTAIVNRLLSDANATPQLVRHGDWDYHLHATPPNAPLATRMAVEAAMALIDVIRADELSRLGVCGYQGCRNVVVDLSKNRSRLYCQAGCGNRAAVAAYRARKAEVAAAAR